MSSIPRIGKKLASQDDELLNQVIRKAQLLTSLNQSLSLNLPSPLNQYCKVANFQAGCLVIAIDSAAWATQLRYLLPTLLDKLAALREFRGLSSIRYYIQPIHQRTSDPKTPQRSLSLSKKNAELIKAVAHHTADNALAQALTKLTYHTKPK